MWNRCLATVRTLGWLVASALAAVVASERIYWYWAGVDADSLSVLTAFYTVAIAVTFLVLARTPGHGLRPAVLGGAVYALVVEGIITPVIYEDGPLPLLYLMFIGWHGLLGFVGFVYLARRWALEGRSLRLGLAAAGVGVGWGAWALASAVTDRTTAGQAALDGGSADVLAPTAFAVYAAWVGVVLIAAHIAMDRLWPQARWSPSRAGVVATGVATVALALVLVIPAVPWAPLKIGVLGFVLWRILRRQAAEPGSPTVIDELAGRVRYRHLLGLALLPGAAALTYAGLWPLHEHNLMAALYWAVIAVQVVAGTTALAWTVFRRPIRPSAVSSIGSAA